MQTEESSISNSNILELSQEPVGKLLFKYGLPAIVGMLLMAIYNIVSRVYIGHGVGPDGIAGLAITFPVTNISTALGLLIGVGAAVHTSLALGQKDQILANTILGNSLISSITLSSLFLIVFYVFMDDILKIFGASPVSLPYAREYMLYLLPGILIMNVCMTFNSIMRASGYPIKAMITMLIGAVVDVVIAPIFIFTLDMGIKGAAIATDISMLLSFIFVFGHFFSTKSNLQFRNANYKWEWPIILKIMAIGLSPFIINIAGSFINALLNNLLYKYGSDLAVATAGIFITYTQVLVIIVIGMCQGMQPIIGYNYGAKKYDRLRKTFLIASVFATIICTLGSVIALSFPEQIGRAFTTDALLIDSTSHALRLACIMFWSVGIQVVSTTLFQSLGMAWRAFFLSLTRQVIFLIPFLFLFSNLYEAEGIWVSFPASDLMATIITLIMLIRVSRIIKRKEIAQK